MGTVQYLLVVALLALFSTTLADNAIVNVIGQYRVRPWNKRSLSSVKYLVVHHSAMRGNGEDEPTLRALQKIHVNTNKWPGLSYHFVIMKNGHIYQVNNLDDRTYTDTINTDSVAILLNGYFHPPYNEQPTAKQIQSLEFVLRRLMSQFKLTKANIRGHRDRTSTACPGNQLYTIVQRYKSNGVPAPPTAPPAPIPNRLPAGRGCVQVDVNLRDSGRLKGDVITVVDQGTTGTIHATAPISEDGYIWYDVTMANKRGWMAQGAKDGSPVYLKSCPDGEPADPNAGGRDITVGTELCLTEAANQRSTPCGTIAATHAIGTRATVVADANNGIDSCGWNWYKVKVGTRVGWMAKGPWMGFCTGAAEYDPDGLDSSVWNKLTPEEIEALAAEGMAGEDASSASTIASCLSLFLFFVALAF